MNLHEFSTLKLGDKIESPYSSESTGEIVETTSSGVRVVWGNRHEHETKFFYSVISTAWMSWNRL